MGGSGLMELVCHVHIHKVAAKWSQHFSYSQEETVVKNKYNFSIAGGSYDRNLEK